jgi:hypothetical protein
VITAIEQGGPERGVLLTIRSTTERSLNPASVAELERNSNDYL